MQLCLFGNPAAGWAADPGETAVLAHLAWTYLHGRIRRGEISVSTARGLWTALSSFASVYGDRAVGHLKRRHVEAWQESEHGLAASTRRLHFGAVRQFCRWLVEEGHVEQDPTRGMRPPRKVRTQPRALPADAVSAALAACPDQRARLVIVLMVQQGLRRMEVAGLDVADVDLTNRLMLVRGKGGHERVLPITDETLAELRGYLGLYPASHGPLIRSYQHPKRGVTPSHIGDMVRRILTDAGVKQSAGDGVSGHAFRHTAATDMLRHGAHVRDVQAALGHRSLVTTETYIPLLVGTLGDAMGGRRYVDGP